MLGLLHTSNHLALISACYPPKPQATPISDLKPDSNALSKLCFYASSRPKKLPKVVAAIHERADRDAKSAASGNAKARADLAVSVDVVRGLVLECRSELQCFAEQALKVVELALVAGKQDSKRDLELEARGAGLFHAVSVLLSGPSVGLDLGLLQQYLRCLSIISSMAQLGSEDNASKWIALAALHGAAVSELLYSTSSDYSGQMEKIIPALLQNLLSLSISDLKDHSSNDSPLPTINNTTTPKSGELSSPARTLGPVSSRKSVPIPAPTITPTPSSLASRAVIILKTIIKLSHAVQLCEKLSATTSWLDKFHHGTIWKEQPELVCWLGTSGVAYSAIQYRANVVGWWADQVSNIEGDNGDLNKHSTLVFTLSSILRGPTTLMGLAIGTVLSQLTSLLIRRTKSGEDDKLSFEIISAISALASHIYYSEQLNDIVSDLIDAIRVVKLGGGESESLNDKQRTLALRNLVAALGGVLEEAEQRNVSSPNTRKKTSSASSSQNKLPLPTNSNSGTSPLPSSNGSNYLNGNGNGNGHGSGTSSRPPLPQGDGTVRGNGILTGTGQGIRSRKEHPQYTNGGESSNGTGSPNLQGGASRRTKVSAEVFRGSLFLLNDSDDLVRNGYYKTLLAFIQQELDVSLFSSSNDSNQNSARFLVDLHAAIYELASPIYSSSNTSSTSPLISPSPITGQFSASSPPPSEPGTSSTDDDPPTTPRGINSLAPNPLVPQIEVEKSRQSSIASRRRSSNRSLSSSPTTIATLEDYSNLIKLVEAIQERASANSVLAAVPMFFALEKDVNRFTGEGIEKEYSRQLIGKGLKTIETTWHVTLPSLPPTYSEEWQHEVVEALAGLQSLHAASGDDRPTLGALLLLPWTPDGARSRASPSNIYRTGSSRSLNNLSTIRITRTPDRARSSQTPSVADLQISLGRPASVRGSATPSIASTTGTVNTFDTRRRTSKTAASTLLQGLTNTRNASKISIRNASRQFGLS